MTIPIPPDLPAGPPVEHGSWFLLLYLFLVATWLGALLISRVPALLHTPLMSGCNAISGVTVVGAILSVRAGEPWLAGLLGFFAIVLATVNVVGGYLVTDRMLGFFRQGDRR